MVPSSEYGGENRTIWKAAPRLDPGGMIELLRSGKVNTILSADSYLKTLVTASITSHFLKEGFVVYLDLDTMFTFLLESGEISFSRMERLSVTIPSGDELDDAISNLYSLDNHLPRLIVFDGVFAYYHIQGGLLTPMRLNQKLSLHLALLGKMAERVDATLLLTGAVRRKRRDEAGLIHWIPAYSGGRVVKKMSSVILRIDDSVNGVKLTVLKHPDTFLSLKVLNLEPLQPHEVHSD